MATLDGGCDNGGEASVLKEGKNDSGADRYEDEELKSTTTGRASS